MRTKARVFDIGLERGYPRARLHLPGLYHLPSTVTWG
jgi:hypothetical protein